MRTSTIIAVYALSLLVSPALAQTSPPTGGTTPPGATSPPAPGGTIGAPAAPPRIPMPDPLTMEDISQIKGSSVYGRDDKKIGDVSTVLMKPDSKTIDRLVVSAGGLLGVGSHRVALPIDEFKWDGDRDAFKIGKTADELKSMPEWKAASASSASGPSSGSSRPPTSSQAPTSSKAPSE